MAYVLEALFGPTATEWQARLPSGIGPALKLHPQLVMLPLTDVRRRLIQALRDEPDKTAPVLGFYELTPAIAAFAADLSMVGTTAYVHAEFFGGTGFQAAVAWTQGGIVFRPPVHC
jgi:hypothetical protein